MEMACGGVVPNNNYEGKEMQKGIMSFLSASKSTAIQWWSQPSLFRYDAILKDQRALATLAFVIARTAAKPYASPESNARPAKNTEARKYGAAGGRLFRLPRVHVTSVVERSVTGGNTPASDRVFVARPLPRLLRAIEIKAGCCATCDH